MSVALMHSARTIDAEYDCICCSVVMPLAVKSLHLTLALCKFTACEWRACAYVVRHVLLQTCLQDMSMIVEASHVTCMSGIPSVSQIY